MKKGVLRASALLLGLSLVGVACGGSDSSAPKVVECTSPVATLGLQFPETGGAALLGAPMLEGAQLAIDEYNAENPDACVALKKFDTQGDPAKAPAVAQAAIDDPAILGIMGPGFSGESNAALPKYEAAGLAAVTGSATNAELQNNEWKVWFRILANDAVQGPGIAEYIANTLKPKSIGIIDDASDYGKGLAGNVKDAVSGATIVTDTINVDAADFAAAVSKMKDANPDVIFYGGYYAEAAKLATQLRDAGVKSQLVFGDGVKSVEGFITAAGPAAEGAIVACPCKDGGADFTAKWRAKYDKAPGTYGTEYYDIANLYLSLIKAGAKDRATVLAGVKAANFKGITKTIKFEANGDVVASEAGKIYISKVENGEFTALETIDVK